MGKSTITVRTDEENPEPVEMIADAIMRVADAFDRINKSSLSERAIILLLHDAIGASNISKKQIGYVLKYAPLLKNYYLRTQGKNNSIT